MSLFEKIFGRGAKIFPLFNMKKTFSAAKSSFFSMLEEEEEEPVKFKARKTQDDVSRKFKGIYRTVARKKYHQKIASVGARMAGDAQQNLAQQNLVVWNADTPNNPEATCQYCWGLHGQMFPIEEAPWPAHTSCDCELIDM